MTYDPNAYDNRGFSDLDRSDDFQDYMERATEPGGEWDYRDGDHAAEAITDYEWGALKADMARFMALHDNGEYRQAADIIHAIVVNFCDAGAKADYNAPETDY